MTKQPALNFIAKCMGISYAQILKMDLAEVRAMWNYIGLPPFRLSIYQSGNPVLIPVMDLGYDND